MSMELFVLSGRRLASIDQWQEAICAEGFPLQLSTNTPFEELNGILPVRLGDKPTDFECAHCEPREVIETYSEIDFAHNWAHCLSFQWGGSLQSDLAARMAAAAYAKATSGVVFDPQESSILMGHRAVEVVRGCEQELPANEEELARVVEEVMARMASATEAKDPKEKASSRSWKVVARRVN